MRKSVIIYADGSPKEIGSTVHLLKLVTGVDISTRPVNRLGRPGKAVNNSRRRAAATTKRPAVPVVAWRLELSLAMAQVHRYRQKERGMPNCTRFLLMAQCRTDLVLRVNNRELQATTTWPVPSRPSALSPASDGPYGKRLETEWGSAPFVRLPSIGHWTMHRNTALSQYGSRPNFVEHPGRRSR